jgi:chromosome segregation ATPase
MIKTVDDLEKEFYIQRDRMLKELNKKEQELRNGIGKLLGQVSILKKKQNQLQLLDNKAKKKLVLMQQKLDKMKKQEKGDQNTIVYMKNRIKQLRREIPILEKNIRKIIPERNKIARMDGSLTRMLKPLNKTIMEKQSMINALRLKMKKLNKKEAFIKQGTIVWGEFKPKTVKKKQTKKVIVKKPKEKSIFDIFSIKH